MKFYVTEDVFSKLPDLQFGLVSVAGVNNAANNEEIRKFLQESVASCEEQFGGQKVKNEPELQLYREAFRTIGINPNRYMCAIEALLTRISKNQGMPMINSAVDLGNAVSLKYHLPVGAHDLDTMDGEFCVKTAGNGDTFLPFGAEEREEVPEGEVVYATKSRVRTRRWTWRQGDEGKILDTTKDLLYIVDGFEDNLDKVICARDELAEKIAQYFGCEVKKGLINKESMEFETRV